MRWTADNATRNVKTEAEAAAHWVLGAGWWHRRAVPPALEFSSLHLVRDVRGW